MGDAPAIEVETLAKTYHAGLVGQKRFEALRGVSFSVNQGEIFGLLGPNGAGKTTFVKILLGIVRKTGGAAQVFRHPAGSKAARRMVGYLPENLHMPRHLTGFTALEYYGALSGLSLGVVRQRRDALFELVGLSDRAKDSVRTYSKGMLQRLGLAQALLHEPKMLVLDEPTDGLDPLARSQVRVMLARLKTERGTTIFLNSHILQEVELVCDRVAILDKGQLRYVGSVKDIGARGLAPVAPDMPAPDKPAPDKPVSDKPARDEVAAAPAPVAIPKKAPPVAEGAASGLQVDLELVGKEAAIHQALGDDSLTCDVQGITPAADGVIRVEARMSDQDDVDRCVDLLRSRRVSIVGLSRKRVSLEDAFLAILAEPAE